MSCQSSLSCRPKASFFSVRSCYHLQSHIKTVFVLCFDFTHTENSKSTGLFEREREKEREFQMLLVHLSCACLWVRIKWLATTTSYYYVLHTGNRILSFNHHLHFHKCTKTEWLFTLGLCYILEEAILIKKPKETKNDEILMPDTNGEVWLVGCVFSFKRKCISQLRFGYILHIDTFFNRNGGMLYLYESWSSAYKLYIYIYEILYLLSSLCLC